MRKLFAIIILLCVIYFIGGWFAVRWGWVSRDDYFAYSGIVGGLASVAGLFSLTRPAISVSDVESIEAAALRSIAATAVELKELQSQRSKTAEEIDGLEQKRKEMELMVKKASLAIFLKEQYSYRERQVLELIDKSPELMEAIKFATEVATKLKHLDEEIEQSPHVKQLREIISSSSRKPTTLDEAIRDMPPLVRSLFILLRDVGMTYSNIFGSLFLPYKKRGR